MAEQAFRFRGTLLPHREVRDVFVVDGHVTYEPISAATLVTSGGWLVPGLVDAHCHVGLGEDGGRARRRIVASPRMARCARRAERGQ